MLVIPKAHNPNSNPKGYTAWCESRKNREMTYAERKANPCRDRIIVTIGNVSAKGLYNGCLAGKVLSLKKLKIWKTSNDYLLEGE